MKVLKLKNEKVAKKLTYKLVKKGLVVAQAEKEEDLNKDFIKKADVVILL